MPEGIRWKRNSWPALTTVWPALLPPCERITMSAFSERRSMILPFPSSPHWPPTRMVTTRLAPASPVEIGELRLLVDEEQLELPGRSVAMLGDKDLGDVTPVFSDVVVVETLAINEEHDVGVLLDRVMNHDVARNEIVKPIDRQIVNILFSVRYNRLHAVPVHVARGQAPYRIRLDGNGQASGSISPKVLLV